LAVERVLDGFSSEEVADFLGVDSSSVRRWVALFHRRGVHGLMARQTPGRPAKLTRTQEKIALRWLADNPTEHGFATELWSAARLAQLMHQEWGVRLNHQYLTRWLRARGFSPQKPERRPWERNPEAIAAWLKSEWVRIKKRAATACAPDFYR
jgi:transposase